MTRKEALHRIMECIASKVANDCDTREIAELILIELGPIITLEPTIMEMSATLRGVGRMARG